MAALRHSCYLSNAFVTMLSARMPPFAFGANRRGQAGYLVEASKSVKIAANDTDTILLLSSPQLSVRSGSAPDDR